MQDARRVGLVLAAIFAAGAVSTAYLPLWFTDQGLTPGQIGLVLGLASVLRVVGVPGGGWLADRIGRRSVLVAAAGLAAAAALALPSLHGVAALLPATVVLGVCASLLSPLMDAVTLALARAGRLDYGPTRAWGSVAYMLATAGAGALLARSGSGVVPVLLLIGYAAAAVSAVRVPDVPTPRMTGDTLIAAEGPFRSPGFRWALLATVLIQGSHAAYYGFATLHWRAAGIGDTTIGLLIAEGILAEVALFLWGKRLIERLGPPGLTACAAAACLLRWTVTGLTVEVAALAAVQLLHAVTFAFQHLSTMLVLGRLPPQRAAMAQALMSAIGFSLATGVLVWATGQAYGTWHGLVFLPMAAVGGLALLTVAPLSRTAAGSRR
ncbi:MAG: MFS transporter [Janthinobacterium lividum]